MLIAVLVACVAVVATGVVLVKERTGVGGCQSGLSSYRTDGRLLHSRAVDSLLVVPGSPSKLWLTTADARLFEGTTTNGVFAWRAVGSTPGQIVAQTDEGRELYATFNALYRSGNAGRSWRRLSCGLEIGSTAIVDDSTFYLATVQGIGGGTGGGLYRTTNGGKSWKRFTHLPGGEPRSFGDPFGDPSVGSVTVVPDRPREVVVGGHSGALDVSTDGGDHWAVVRVRQP